MLAGSDAANSKHWPAVAAAIVGLALISVGLALISVGWALAALSNPARFPLSLADNRRIQRACQCHRLPLGHNQRQRVTVGAGWHSRQQQRHQLQADVQAYARICTRLTTPGYGMGRLPDGNQKQQHAAACAPQGGDHKMEWLGIVGIAGVIILILLPPPAGDQRHPRHP